MVSVHVIHNLIVMVLVYIVYGKMIHHHVVRMSIDAMVVYILVQLQLKRTAQDALIVVIFG